MKKLFLFCFALMMADATAQTLSTSVPETQLNVGEEGAFHLEIDHLQNKNIRIAAKGELLPFHFEIIRDSIRNDGQKYVRDIAFQVFNEGSFEIPALEIGVGDQVMTTVPYQIDVENESAADEELSDIKPIREAKLSLGDYWYFYGKYVLALLGLAVVLWLIFRLPRYLRERKESPKLKVNKALKALRRLSKKKLIENRRYREFYIELLDISRDFLAERFHIPARELLKEDLIRYLTEKKVVPETQISVLDDIFSRGDLAKFAKMIPQEGAMEQDLQKMRQLVKDSLQVTDQQSENEENDEDA